MSARPGDTAIVGMAAIFPGAPDLASYWANIERGVDAITDVPATRIDRRFFADETRAGFTCRRGGFIDDIARFDPTEFGIMPNAADKAEPDQLVTLTAAARALEDAGLDPQALPSDRVGVILGRGGYLTPGMARLDQYVRTAAQLEAVLAAVPGADPDAVAGIVAAFRAQVGSPGGGDAIGLVPNLAASRIANRFDIVGPAYTVDAACASALVAVDQARIELLRGRCDVVVAGGVHLCHDVTFWTVFHELGAVSASQSIRPFDRRADGLLIGEGAGLMVLKRLDDAERDGDRIYAVIRGSGVASDGRESSLMKPRVSGQVKALELAWADAQLDPATAGLVEAHGTATPAGDRAELTTLRQVFGDGGDSIALGSVKSMIGHAMPAAGAAGMIKAALAVYHGVVPPTLHVDEPHELLADARFRTAGTADAWRGPRRAGVNAFGFGGINAHVVMDQHARSGPAGSTSVSVASAATPALPPLSVWAAESPEALATLLESGAAPGGSGPCRLAVLEPTPKKLERAAAIARRGKRLTGRKGFWFSPRGLARDGGKIAFLFPGIEASFEPRVDDVADHFGLPFAPWQGGSDLERHGGELVEVCRLLNEALGRLGVTPDVIAGHSIGEWSGMIASGMIPPDALQPFLASLEPGELEVANVVFAAVGCGRERAAEILGELGDIEISHDNCPHQIIVCGPEGSVAAAAEKFRDARVLCQVLPFRSGFHSRAFEPYLGSVIGNINAVPLTKPRVPLASATTAELYPAGEAEIRNLAVRHLIEPVRFRELTERLHDDGVRLFVQVGTGSLVGFVEDTLRGRPHLAVTANTARRTGLEQLSRLAAALWVEGVDVNFEGLPLAVSGWAPARRKAERGRPVVLGTPLVDSVPVAALVPASPAAAAVTVPAVGLPGVPATASSAVAAEFQRTMHALAGATEVVTEALSRVPASRAPARPAPVAAGPAPRTLQPRHSKQKLSLSLADYPDLIDHCFYRQPDDWPHAIDRFPVVPMTMHLELMMQAARELVPERMPVAIEDARAFRWCAVEPPIEVGIDARFDGDSRVAVRIGSYATGTVVLADGFPEAPPSRAPEISEPEPVSLDGAGLYEERWMFHGPAYQGIDQLGPTGEDGIEGTLVCPPAPGALLDNVGQLFGYWVMTHVEQDFLAFPIKIDRLSFFGPPPAVGEHLRCLVTIERLTDDDCTAHMELINASGAVYAVIRGWTDRRFDSDPHLWEMLRKSETCAAAVEQPGGYVVCPERWRTAASRELIARRFFDSTELAEFEASAPKRKRVYMLGRMAAKDAVRLMLWRRGRGGIFPIEVPIRSDDEGRPFVAADLGADVRVSIAHKDYLAVAIAGVGRDVGIDIERVEERTEGFMDIAFTPAERALASGSGAEREWLTRFWSAKEACGKALRTGLAGNPRNFEITEVDGERLYVVPREGEPQWIETTCDGTYVVAWTPTNDEFDDNQQ